MNKKIVSKNIKYFLSQQFVLIITLIASYFIMFYIVPALYYFMGLVFKEIYGFKEITNNSALEALSLLFGLLYKGLMYFTLGVFFCIQEFRIIKTLIYKIRLTRY